jgi:hypothetical protein
MSLRLGGRLCTAVVHPFLSAQDEDSMHPAAFRFSRPYLAPHRYVDRVQARDGLTMTFTSMHRPLSACTSALLAHGMVISDRGSLPVGTRQLALAADAATLDILAPGRVLFGIGAGHTPREWEDIGRRRPGPGERAERLVEFVEAVAGLLKDDTVTREGAFLTLRGSQLDGLPVGHNVGHAVGGQPEVLRVAARRADVVGLSGLGRTLPMATITRPGGQAQTCSASCSWCGRRHSAPETHPS